jgi:hypothetical protein
VSSKKIVAQKSREAASQREIHGKILCIVAPDAHVSSANFPTRAYFFIADSSGSSTTAHLS